MFGQHIQNIASFFGTFDVSLPFAGPLSDKLGRRISVLIGAASYVIFFIGIAFSPNIQVAYVAAVLGGIAIGILGVLAIFAPMPAGNAAAKSESFISSLKNANFSVESIALILIASSLCNYTILSAAAKMSSMQVIMMNIVITVIGVLLAVFVNVRYGSLLAKTEQ
ncbi:MAG: MFS transporter [Coprococcus sp.]|nr:MFS transporter [Coprococcus sp.]